MSVFHIFTIVVGVTSSFGTLVLGSIPQTHNRYVNTVERDLCDCDYHTGGCFIVNKASPNWACKCVYKGAWTCGGSMAKCLDPTSRYCTHPDTSVQSCVMGGGDCGGYDDAKCDCDYRPGGCTISKAPPHDTACHCTYKGAWTCGGHISQCRSFSNQYCKKPDMSIYTCIQGFGDCGGY